MDFLAKLKEFNERSAILHPIGLNSRVLLVDSLNTYCRCFAATPTMDENGDHVGGITGYLKSVGMSIRHLVPSRVICVFDGTGGSQRRRQVYEGYKDNRKPFTKLNRTYDFNSLVEEQQSMKKQLQILVHVLERLPLTIYSINNIEADDTIAYLVSLIEEKGGQSIIMSTDKDFLQLVSPSCQVYNPIKKKLYTEQIVLEEYGIHPINFLLYRILTGDKSDNIPGVKGIGPATLIKLFPDLAKNEKMNIQQLLEMCNSKFLACEKLKSAFEEGLIERNNQLMNLKELNFSGTTKLDILDKFEKNSNELDKYLLTKLMKQFKLLDSFGNYDDWVTKTWLPLSRIK